MSESSSSGNQGDRNQGSSNRRQGGNRNRNRNRSQGESRSGGRTNAERVRRPAPKPTGFQKFIKAITFGLVDLTPKRGKGKKGGAGKSAKSGEKRAPRLIEPTSPRLYVGNLNYDATEDELKEYFSSVGEVQSATIIRQPGSDRSKGFGFIEMSSLEEAKNASFNLNDKEFKGRKMLVTGAKPERKRDDDRGPRQDRGERSSGGRREGGREGRSGGRGRDGRSGGRDGGGRKGSGDRVEKPTRTVKPLEIEVVTSPQLKLGQINATATDEDINDLFNGIGTLQKRDAIGEAAEGAVTRDYTVELTDVAEAQKAVEFLHDKTFMGHTISVTGVAAE
ncbi:RNA-binding protein [Verrucomicrobiales bacterium BCK34]|nr:RNA-binding protein [Verrucomicrobiales bacterium BCK34]